MVEMMHVDPDELLLDSFRLGRLVYESGFRPKHAISIWRGGTPIGLGVDAFFRMRGLTIHHTSVATASYDGIHSQGEVVVKGLEHLTSSVCREDGLLIIDDVFDSGRTIQKIMTTLRQRARKNTPSDIRVAVVHRKERDDQFDEVPVYSVHRLPENLWIDYPHELADLVREGDPEDSLIAKKSEAIRDVLHAPMHRVEDVALGDEAGYASARMLLLDSMRLGVNIVRSGFEPDFIVALWPGGVQSGLVVHEVHNYFRRKLGRTGPGPDHIALNTTSTHLSYRTDILGIEYLADRVDYGHRLLLVDTTFKSGRVISDAVNTLKELLRRNLDLSKVKIASVYWNPDDESTWTVSPFKRKPDWYLKKVDNYMVYPHAAHRFLDPMKQLRRHNPELREILFGG